ncbi:hypothetical protein EZS27_011579 [termite gut metagenome]|uniref:Uncharacterized protein n=1 Tax=termite gut metagenome TaxID=433724 RepID=A0A5J4S5P7_9ZZZZ
MKLLHLSSLSELRKMNGRMYETGGLLFFRFFFLAMRMWIILTCIHGFLYLLKLTIRFIRL